MNQLIYIAHETGRKGEALRNNIMAQMITVRIVISIDLAVIIQRYKYLSGLTSGVDINF
jgi:hypothetical protein